MPAPAAGYAGGGAEPYGAARTAGGDGAARSAAARGRHANGRARMTICYTTEAAPATPPRPNEDHVVCGPDWAVVLDGATPAPGADSGCRHGVPWLVGRLGGALALALSSGTRAGLADILEQAIRDTMAAHADTCDLANPRSPSATVSIVRRRGDTLDYLALCDSPIVLRHRDGSVRVVLDDRTARLPGGRPYPPGLVDEMRNRPGGFWVASTKPEAAREALTGAVPVTDLDGVLVCTDGVHRLVEWYGHTWAQVVTIAEKYGPARLVELVREAERTHGPRGTAKVHDDATAVWIPL